jgi:hypothetical protein
VVAERDDDVRYKIQLVSAAAAAAMSQRELVLFFIINIIVIACDGYDIDFPSH